MWPEGKIPDSAQYSLDELKRRGHRGSLSNRSYQVDAKRFAEQAGLTDFVADGGHSVTVNNELVSMIGMDRDACINYLEYLESIIFLGL